MELYQYIQPQIPPKPPAIKQPPILASNIPQPPQLIPTPPVQQNITCYSELGREYRDVFTNLPDGPLWLELFIIADGFNQELAEILEYVRNVGAKLIQDNYYGFIIEPIVDPSGCYGWSSMEQYREERKWLVPHTDILLKSLKILRERYDNRQIMWGGR